MNSQFQVLQTLSPAEAVAFQERYAGLVETADRLPELIRRVAGVDVAYDRVTDRLFAAVVVLAFPNLELIETATHVDRVTFPYLPGLFSFREFPPLAKALEKLSQPPDLLVCDGQGVAHPRRFGLACHVGVAFDIPAIGCAKDRLIGDFDPPGEERGVTSPMIDNGETIGAALRTQNGIKPVFVSVGHRVSLTTACAWILRLTTSYRQPEPIRAANHLANKLRHDADK